MSAGGAFGGARGYQPKPPDKGVFPLDHFGECKAVQGPNRQAVAAWRLWRLSPDETQDTLCTPGAGEGAVLGVPEGECQPGRGLP